MKTVIFVIILIIKKCYSINGVIWTPRNGSFVPIFSIEPFKTMQDEILQVSRQIENYKFHGDKIYFLYFYERNVFEFYDKDSKATGVCGDIWSLLSEILNFTMILNKADVKTIGAKFEPNAKFTGLLGLMEEGNYTIIPRMEAYIPRLEAVDFTSAFWKDHYRTFIRPYYKFKIAWMLHLFSDKIWLLVITFYILLSILSIVSQKMTADEYSYNLMSSAQDHFFYAFAALCNQGDVLYMTQKNSKILSFCISMFSWLLMTSFSSHLIIYMTQTVLIKPFDDLETLLDGTDYTVLAEKNSVVYIGFTKNYKPIYTRITKADRIRYYESYNHIWDLTCYDKKKFAVLQSWHLKMNNMGYCQLYPIGPQYFNTWIVAGVAKNFPHKKTINHSIIKLHEFGIINGLMARWLRVKSVDDENITQSFTPITFHQVILLISVYVFGFCISIIILIVENLGYTSIRPKIKKSK